MLVETCLLYSELTRLVNMTMPTLEKYVLNSFIDLINAWYNQISIG